MKKRVLVLGCTGSIGKSTLDIIDSFNNEFQVVGLSAFSNKEQLEKDGHRFNCHNLCLAKDNKKQLIEFIKSTDADICVNGIAGSAGLLPSVAALESGMDLALANKETMVMAGTLIKNLANKNDCKLLPVDSEHSAVFMLTEKYGAKNLDKIILTASGGPFRKFSKAQLANVTLEDALKHPTWNMGQKITIDSASLANKGLEVIEACMLFDVPPEKVQVVVHPQSIVHSLIRTIDGVMYAQLSKPDMRHPIVTALTYPNFEKNNLPTFDFLNFDEDGCALEFYPPRKKDFPMLNYAYEAASKGIGSQIAYNAANEIAVEKFVQRKISFNQIPDVTKKALDNNWNPNPSSFDEVFEIDTMVRKLCTEYAETLC